MSDQVFRSGKPVTARSIVTAAMTGDVSTDEAVELVELLIEIRARGLDMLEVKSRRKSRGISDATPQAGRP
ncbi:hypothetical protein C7S15_8891 (plasmid) [Burkholderia cepacia]|uniref:hypothetical protein n=1 Tax=Burkholderia cepacia TaxID=292 RepID=UPI00298F432A|nr:hypothetical protein [Burkholderia cepacia]MDW9232897.1 hypothetical protein [Burkholderia cepacia]